MLSYCCGGSLGRFCEAWPEGCILRGLHVCDVWAVAFVVLCQQLQTKLCLTSIAIFSITTKPQAHRAAWSSELQDTTTHAKTQGTCDTPNPMQFHKWWIFSNLKSWSFWVLHVDNGQSNGTSSFACGDCVTRTGGTFAGNQHFDCSRLDSYPSCHWVHSGLA